MSELLDLGYKRMAISNAGAKSKASMCVSQPNGRKCAENDFAELKSVI